MDGHKVYHFAAEICSKTEEGKSLKGCLYATTDEELKKKLSSVRALVDKTLRNKDFIDGLINRTELCKETVLSELWVTRVLVTELVFGKKSFMCSDSVTIKVYQYKDKFKTLAAGAIEKKPLYMPHYCRINTTKCTKYKFHSSMQSNFVLKVDLDKSVFSYEKFLDEIKNLKIFEYIQDYHLPDLYVFHPQANLVPSTLYEERKIILQDKASCLVAPLLAPLPGSLVLDMCAAPGNKTQHLSSIIGNTGLIIATDLSKTRHAILAKNRSNFELANVITFHADAIHLPECLTKYIEYILLDAPCSGSGIALNYDYGSSNHKSGKRLLTLHNLQSCLLRSALTKYPSVRRIVYSTCSLNEEENEAVVDELLETAKKNKFILVNLKNYYQDFSTGMSTYTCGPSCIKMKPEQSLTNGFFIAMFERPNPSDPAPRIEFYQNVKSILDSIGQSLKKRKSADDPKEKCVENKKIKHSVERSSEKSINKTSKLNKKENGCTMAVLSPSRKGNQNKSSVTPTKIKNNRSVSQVTNDEIISSNNSLTDSKKQERRSVSQVTNDEIISSNNSLTDSKKQKRRSVSQVTNDEIRMLTKSECNNKTDQDNSDIGKNTELLIEGRNAVNTEVHETFGKISNDNDSNCSNKQSFGENSACSTYSDYSCDYNDCDENGSLTDYGINDEMRNDSTTLPHMNSNCRARSNYAQTFINNRTRLCCRNCVYRRRNRVQQYNNRYGQGVCNNNIRNLFGKDFYQKQRNNRYGNTVRNNIRNPFGNDFCQKQPNNRYGNTIHYDWNTFHKINLPKAPQSSITTDM